MYFQTLGPKTLMDYPHEYSSHFPPYYQSHFPDDLPFPLPWMPYITLMPTYLAPAQLRCAGTALENRHAAARLPRLWPPSTSRSHARLRFTPSLH